MINQQKIQVRIAETGFFDHFLEQPHITTVGDLIKYYQKINNNQFSSARVFTKGGYIKSRQELLTQNNDVIGTHQESEKSQIKCAKDISLKELTYSCANDQQMKTQLKCYYLFADTMLEKDYDTKWAITQNEAMVSLQQKCKQFNELNTEVFEIKLPKKQTMLCLNDQMPIVGAFMIKFHEKYTRFNKLREQLKIVCNHIQLSSQKCENQRKAIFVLYTYLEKYIRSLEKKMTSLKNQMLKIRSEIQLGQSNSQSFRKGSNKSISQTIKNQARQRYILSAESYDKKIQELDCQILKLKKLQINNKSQAKEECKKFHQKLIKTNQKISQNCQKIDDIFRNIQQKYLSWKQQVSKLISEQQDPNKSQQHFFKRIIQKEQEKYIDQSIVLVKKLIIESKSQFLNIFNANMKLKPLVCEFYRFFDEVYKQFEQKWSQMKDLMTSSNIFLNELIGFNNEHNKFLTDAEQSQFIRRVNFNKQLNYMYRRIRDLVNFESMQRKKYIGNIKQQQKLYYGFQIYDILKVDSVPKIDLDYGQSTDLQLIKKMGLQTDQDSANSYRGYDQKRVLEELQQYSIKVSSFLDKDRQLPESIKVKNLIEILQSSSKVYYNVYANKLQSETTKMKNLQRMVRQKSVTNQKYREELEQLRKRMTKIERQFDIRAQKDGKQMQKLNCWGSKLQVQNMELIREIERLNKQIDRVSKQDKSQQLQKCLIKVESVQRQKREFIDKLMRQLKLTQQLSDSYGTVEAENTDLKEQLANSHIQIIRLQKQLQALQLLYTIAANSVDPNGKDQNVFRQHSDSQNTELKQEIQRLRNRVQQLEENINQIVNDFKDTQDQQVQVQFDQQKIKKINVYSQTEIDHSFMDYTLISSRLSLNNVKQGNRCVFLPFDSTTYIAVCLPQNSQYDTGNTHYFQNTLEKDHFYVLDLKSLPLKAQQLLSECSLIVIAKIQKITHRPEQGCSFVAGKVQYAIGFEDDDRILKNYSTLLYQP